MSRRQPADLVPKTRDEFDKHRPAVEAYLNGGPMTGEQIAAMRAYLRQWINAPGWVAPCLPELRADIDNLTTWTAIDRWIHRAYAWGIDPL